MSDHPSPALPLHAPLDPALANPAPRAAGQSLRQVARAVSDLRRGVPVVLDGPAPLILLPAEVATAETLRELTEAGQAPMLLITAARAEALGLNGPHPIIALPLDQDLLSPDALRRLADPTAGDAPRHPAPAAVPPGADAALSLARQARLLPAVIVAQLRGTSAAPAGLLRVAAPDVLAAPAQADAALVQVAGSAVPLEDAADTRIIAFRAPETGLEHLAIVVGHPDRPDAAGTAPLVRLHSECLTGDVLGSLRCDCGDQLRHALRRMQQDGGGVLLYLAQEGRGIGLVNKLRAYTLQDHATRPLDTLDANRALGWDADARDFAAAATMLRALGIGRIRLLTNNPAKLEALRAHGIDTVREPHEAPPNGVNDGYLATKAARFGHLLGGA